MAILGRLMAAIRGTEYVGADEQGWLDGCADMGDQRCDRYTMYDQFYRGERGAKLRDRARAYLNLSGVAFCENFAEPVVDALAERLEVIGFTSSLAETQVVEGVETPSDPVAELAEQWWQRGRMDAVQAKVHLRTLVDGDGYVIVEWNEEADRPRFLRQRPHQVRVWYSDDDPDVIEYASKTWFTQQRGPQNEQGRRIQRLNVFFPDQVQKWFRPHTGSATSGSGGWERWSDEGEGGWPVWWTSDRAEGGDPLGVPVVHFRYKPDSAGGGSSRVHAVIPFQEQLNKNLIDLNDLIDNHALPQDYATGVSGDMTLLRIPGDVWKATSSESKFGRLEATPTANLLDAIEGVLSRLARRSRTPMHLLTGGTPPSGESLKTSESGLVATAKDCQVEFGNSWEDALMIGLRLAAAFGATPIVLPEDLTLEVQWENPETRSDQSDLAVAEAKHRLGFSKHTLIQELGGDPEKEAERRRAETEESAEAFGKAFDRGVIPGE